MDPVRARCLVIWLLLPLLSPACSDSRAVPGSGGTTGGGTTGGGHGGMVGTVAGTGGGGGVASGDPGAAGATATGGVGGGPAGGTTGGGGGGGTSGGAGAPPRGSGEGVLYPCPEPPPSMGDPCPNESITCTYPGRKSCACYNTGSSLAWSCADCPANRPGATDFCNALPFRVSLSCNYGNETCSCERRTISNAWRCGICPVSEPLAGDLCGNVPAGECRYGADTCRCGTNGAWSCATATCPANLALSSGSSSCTSPNSAYTCHYPDQDQDCLCLPKAPGEALPFCSCPASRPANGGACIASPITCVYDDVRCSCAGTWSCVSTTPPNPCPSGQPMSGGVCSVRISTCVYGSVICSCDGTSWSCA